MLHEGHEIVESERGITVIYPRTLSVYRIGELVDVVVGEALNADQ